MPGHRTPIADGCTREEDDQDLVGFGIVSLHHYVQVAAVTFPRQQLQRGAGHLTLGRRPICGVHLRAGSDRVIPPNRRIQYMDGHDRLLTPAARLPAAADHGSLQSSRTDAGYGRFGVRPPGRPAYI
ncbi:MAG TPA: hypothetical protein VGS19_02975 [Streptosporangiaceae bacterium]|nr:hypothetical protein [Streptosporangiaceae bacterium]